MDSHTHTNTHSQRRTYLQWNQMKINVWHSILQQNIQQCIPRCWGQSTKAFRAAWMDAAFNAIRHWHCSMRHIYRRTDCRCSDVLPNVAWTQTHTHTHTRQSMRTKVICKLFGARRTLGVAWFITSHHRSPAIHYWLRILQMYYVYVGGVGRKWVCNSKRFISILFENAKSSKFKNSSFCINYRDTYSVCVN